MDSFIKVGWWGSQKDTLFQYKFAQKHASNSGKKIFYPYCTSCAINRLLPIVCQEADVWNGEDHL